MYLPELRNHGEVSINDVLFRLQQCIVQSGGRPVRAGQTATQFHKGVTLLRAGELTLDSQVDVGRRVKFETN
jgi:hypothetical protein